MDTQDLLATFGQKAAVGADTSARPWEAVGGVGFDAPKKVKEPLYIPPTTRPELNSSSPEAVEVAEEFNDRSVKAFKAKNWQLCYDLASESIRARVPRKARACVCVRACVR